MWGYTYSFYQPATTTSELVVDRDAIDRDVRLGLQTQKLRRNHLAERAHFLNRKWLPHRPKKLRWNKG